MSSCTSADVTIAPIHQLLSRPSPRPRVAALHLPPHVCVQGQARHTRTHTYRATHTWVLLLRRHWSRVVITFHYFRGRGGVVICARTHTRAAQSTTTVRTRTHTRVIQSTMRSQRKRFGVACRRTDATVHHIPQHFRRV